MIGVNNESIFGETKEPNIALLHEFLSENRDGFRHTTYVDNAEGYAKESKLTKSVPLRTLISSRLMCLPPSSPVVVYTLRGEPYSLVKFDLFFHLLLGIDDSLLLKWCDFSCV